jgi:hypothetical protein
MKRAIAASSTLRRLTSVRLGISVPEYKETRELFQLVTDEADLLRLEGEKTFTGFHRPGSRCRQDETSIFILDLKGNMLFYPGSSIEGKNEIDPKDFSGKSIIRELVDAGTALAGRESHPNKIFSLKPAPARHDITLAIFHCNITLLALALEKTICANLTTLNRCADDDQSWLLPEPSNLAPAAHPQLGGKTIRGRRRLRCTNMP